MKPKIMTEIRDAEAEAYIDVFRCPIEDNDLVDAFQAGFDCRDKLGDEALKLAVEKLKQIAGEHEIYCCDDKTDCEWTAKEALAEIRKLMEEK